MKVIFGIALTWAGLFITASTLKMQVLNVTKTVQGSSEFFFNNFCHGN